MALQDTTPKEAERLKAYELYLNANLQGKRRSMRSIALELGVNPTTVTRWAEMDGWSQKVHAALLQTTQAAEATQNALKRLVRRGLLDGLTELHRIATKADRESDRIGAVRAMVDIALRIDAVTAAAGGGKDEQQPANFSDDLPAEEPTCPSVPSEITASPTASSSLSESDSSAEPSPSSE